MKDFMDSTYSNILLYIIFSLMTLLLMFVCFVIVKKLLGG
jgi:hypothetical protein